MSKIKPLTDENIFSFLKQETIDVKQHASFSRYT